MYVKIYLVKHVKIPIYISSIDFKEPWTVLDAKEVNIFIHTF